MVREDGDDVPDGLRVVAALAQQLRVADRGVREVRAARQLHGAARRRHVRSPLTQSSAERLAKIAIFNPSLHNGILI